MHDPHEPHLTSAKRILRFLQGTLDHDLLLRRASTSNLILYTDTDWKGCPDTHRSPSSYAVFLGCRLLLLKAPKHCLPFER
jgi:hypothetical protein